MQKRPNTKQEVRTERNAEFDITLCQVYENAVNKDKQIRDQQKGILARMFPSKLDNEENQLSIERKREIHEGEIKALRMACEGRCHQLSIFLDETVRMLSVDASSNLINHGMNHIQTLSSTLNSLQIHVMDEFMMLDDYGIQKLQGRENKLFINRHLESMEKRLNLMMDSLDDSLAEIIGALERRITAYSKDMGNNITM